MNQSPRIRTVLGCTLLVAALGAGTAACGNSSNPLSAAPYDAADQISFNDAGGSSKKADPDKPLEINTQGDEARITDVTAQDAAGRFVAGELTADGARWHTTAPLTADTRYTVAVSTEDEDGEPGRKVLNLETGSPGKDKPLKVTFGPDDGEYGVGQPLTAELNKPVKDEKSRALVERSLQVDSKPAVKGSWYWVDSTELHYRPKGYWPTHAKITARSKLEGMKIGDRMWGGKSKPLSITTGDRIVAVTNAGAHSMTVYRNGEEVNSMPVTTGKPGYETRNGIKVVLGKEYFVRMRGETIGISEGSSDSYNLPVYWATRVTWSGEYVHAAPWSVGSQGSENVSHGCTGMSTGNASWFYNNVRQGDIVKVVNSNGAEMDHFGNGFGDWNLSWKSWRAGSALTKDAKKPDPALKSRLSPQV